MHLMEINRIYLSEWNGKGESENTRAKLLKITIFSKLRVH